MRRTLKAFSLIEVVAAVAIFAIGMVAVLGLFAPVTKSVSASADAEIAGRIADSVRARMAALPWTTAVVLVQDIATAQKNDADVAYNPNDGAKHPNVIFGKLNGEIGVYDPDRNAWRDSGGVTVTNAEKFFEIDLIRNERLSPLPAAGEPEPILVAYNVRVRWPAFQQTAPGVAVQVGGNPGAPVPFDHSRKQVLFFTGFITR